MRSCQASPFLEIWLEAQPPCRKGCTLWWISPLCVPRKDEAVVLSYPQSLKKRSTNQIYKWHVRNRTTISISKFCSSMFQRKKPNTIKNTGIHNWFLKRKSKLQYNFLKESRTSSYFTAPAKMVISNVFVQSTSD